MPYRPQQAAAGAAPYVHFGGTTLTPYRAFAWSDGGVPVLANSTTTHVAGVTDATGKGGWLAIPGLLVEIEAAAGSHSSGTLYDVNGTGQIGAGASANHFKLWQAIASTDTYRIVLAEFWKPKG